MTKRFFLLFVISFFNFQVGVSDTSSYSPIYLDENQDLISASQTGDLIFIKSTSSQSDIIEVVTNSPVTHVGMIIKEADKTFVYEAINVVSITPIDSFLKRAKGGKFTIKRIKRAIIDLTSRENITKLIWNAKKYKGKSYDIYFEWGPELIYCSELVWLIFYDTFSTQNAPFEISKKEKWKIFKEAIEQSQDASRLMRQRFISRGGVPTNWWEGDIVTPVAVYDSPILETITIKQKRGLFHYLYKLISGT